jgi:hypothetical protein
MSADKDIAKQAGLAAKKASKVLGTGLGKLSQKVKETSRSFKEGLKDDEPEQAPVAEQAPDYSMDEEEPKQSEPVSTQADYSLDE